MQLHLLKRNTWLNTDPLSSFKNKSTTKDLPEKFANLLMKNGCKLKAYKILYNALKILYIKNLNKENYNEKNSHYAGAVNTNMPEKNKHTHNAIYESKENFLAINLVVDSGSVSSQAIESFSKLSNQQKKPITRSKNLNRNKNVFSSIFAKKLLFKAIDNVKPSVEIRSVKVSGRTHQVPAIIYQKRQTVLAMRWLIESCLKKKKTSNLTFSECLANELFEALNKYGKVRQKRDALHKAAESNRASIRFKWW